MSTKGLASLRKWKKCQRRVANAVMRAAKAGKHPRSAELRAAANSLASLACSKGKKMKKTTRKGVRRSKRTPAFTPHIPDFARQHAHRPPPPSAYDDNWGY